MYFTFYQPPIDLLRTAKIYHHIRSTRTSEQRGVQMIPEDILHKPNTNVVKKYVLHNFPILKYFIV